MRMITRTLAVATIGAMIGGMGLVAHAQPSGGPGSGPPAAASGQMGHGDRAMHGGQEHHGFRHGMGDPAAYLTKLRADIEITPAQTAAWDAYAKVVQDTATQMRASRQGMNRHAFLEMSTADRLTLLTKRRDEREQAHGTVKAAAEALLPVLTDTQKVRALMTLPGLASPGRMMMRHHAMRMTHDQKPTSVN